MTAPLTIGFATPVDLWQSTLEQKHDTLARLADAGVDQLYMADHVSFRGQEVDDEPLIYEVPRFG